jgi:hypothetical protein
MPKTGNPQASAAKWAQNLGAAAQQIQAGVMAVQQAPSAQAAAAVQKWVASITSQKAQTDYVNGLNKVTLIDWQNAMKNKGIPRIGQGAQAAQNKFQTFLAALFNYENAGLAQIKAMPSTTLQDRIARMTAWVQYMSGFVKP